MNRREVLLLLAGTAVLPDQLLAIGRSVHKRVRAGTLRALDPHQNETVATIAELIIPKTDTPGARDAGVPAFIDVMLADWGDDDQRQMITAGLANVDERSRAAFGKDFVACPPAQQTEILEDLDYELALRAGAAAGHEERHLQELPFGHEVADVDRLLHV